MNIKVLCFNLYFVFCCCDVIRDKRTIELVLRSVADVFGYDVQKRPAVIPPPTAKMLPSPLAPLPPLFPMSSTKLAVNSVTTTPPPIKKPKGLVSRPNISFSLAFPFKQQSPQILKLQPQTPPVPSMKPKTPPAQPQTSPSPPQTPRTTPALLTPTVPPSAPKPSANIPRLLTETVRKTFNINFNFNKDVQAQPSPASSPPTSSPTKQPPNFSPDNKPSNTPSSQSGSKQNLILYGNIYDNPETNSNIQDRYNLIPQKQPFRIHYDYSEESMDVPMETNASNFEETKKKYENSKDLFRDSIKTFWKNSPWINQMGYKYLEGVEKDEDNNVEIISPRENTNGKNAQRNQQDESIGSLPQDLVRYEEYEITEDKDKHGVNKNVNQNNYSEGSKLREYENSHSKNNKNSNDGRMKIHYKPYNNKEEDENERDAENVGNYKNKDFDRNTKRNKNKSYRNKDYDRNCKNHEKNKASEESRENEEFYDDENKGYNRNNDESENYNTKESHNRDEIGNRNEDSSSNEDYNLNEDHNKNVYHNTNEDHRNDGYYKGEEYNEDDSYYRIGIPIPTLDYYKENEIKSQNPKLINLNDIPTKPYKEKEEESIEENIEESKNSQVVQPLYSGFLPSNYQLFNGEEKQAPWTIPYDVDYSGSEKKKKVKKLRKGPKRTDKKPRRQTDEFKYVPDRYDEEFSYTLPEPSTENYKELEKKEYDDDDEKFSKNARIRTTQIGKKITIVRKKNSK